MSEQNAVLFANAAFYAAFVERDLELMGRIWSQEKSVTCTHPGWQTLDGRDSVMESWNAILSNPDSPEIICRVQRAAVYGDKAL